MLSFLAKYKNHFEKVLLNMLTNYCGGDNKMLEIISYAMTDGGKRIRPVFAYLGAEFCNKTASTADFIALGIECIHSYSLVHDDLPCMDNDTLRRGKPTAHIKFGDGMAVLGGDSLLNLGFEIILSDNNPLMIKSARYIAKHSGISGMIGGQSLDIDIENAQCYNLETIKKLIYLKTTCLLKSALIGGAIVSGVSEEEQQDLEIYIDCVGEIFQIVDDILDVTSTQAILGKNINSDNKNGKVTVLKYLTINEAKEYINELNGKAIEALKKYGERANKLIEFSNYLVNRMY